MTSRYTLLLMFCVGSLLAANPEASPAQCGILIDGSFEDQELGVFNDVVHPEMTAGFWAAENSAIVSTGSCTEVTPYDGSRMLEMSDAADTITELWQAVQVGPDVPTYVTVSAWFNACEGIAAPARLSLRTVNSATSWPELTFNQTGYLDLDTSASTWEQISLENLEIPADTEWLLIVIYFHAEELGSLHGYVDDVQVECHYPVAAEHKSWGVLRALYGN